MGRELRSWLVSAHFLLPPKELRKDSGITVVIRVSKTQRLFMEGEVEKVTGLGSLYTQPVLASWRPGSPHSSWV